MSRRSSRSCLWWLALAAILLTGAFPSLAQSPTPAPLPAGRQLPPPKRTNSEVSPHVVQPSKPAASPPASGTVRPGRPAAPAAPVQQYTNAIFMRGMNYVSHNRYGTGYASDNQINSFMKPAGINWVSIVPSCYQNTATSTTISCDASVNDDLVNGSRGYTPTNTDVRAAITAAHNAGLKVTLKPQIELMNDDAHYRGDIGFGTDNTKWQQWFASYKTNLIGRYAAIAKDTGVEYFVVGTELQNTNRVNDSCVNNPAAAQRETDWRGVVVYLRTIYSGPITYGANWGTYSCAEVLNVLWWDTLTTIGVDGYYPLTDNNNMDPTHPVTTAELVAGWLTTPASANGGITPINSLAALSAAHNNQKIILTEVGYQSQRGTGNTPYGIYTSPDPPVYQEEQALCYDATLRAFTGQPWLAGMFWWAATIVYGQPASGPDTPDNNYTPIGKLAGGVLKQYFLGPQPVPPRR